MNKKIILGLTVLVILFFISGCTQQEQSLLTNKEIQELQNKANLLDGKEQELSSSNLKVIELQENDKYLRGETQKVKGDLDKIERVYSKLFTDATSCYWAVTCRDYESYCVEHFKEVSIGWSSKELASYYTKECEGMERDWAEYRLYDREVN